MKPTTRRMSPLYHGLSVNHLVLAFAVVTDNLGNHEVALQEIANLLDGIFENHLVRNLYGEGVQGHRFKMSLASLSFTSSFCLSTRSANLNIMKLRITPSTPIG